MSTSIVSVQRLSHRYAKSWAVKNVSLTIPDSGVIGLLGVNGAGKSTLLNLVCGVITATEGDVFVGGHSIRRDPLKAKAELGFLPQIAPLYPENTIREYLQYSAKLRRLEKSTISDAVDAVMVKCGVTHFADRLIRALSGGYRQRVGIAQAIIHSPRLVVLDEPTNGLDPNQIQEVRRLIREIAEERSVLLSTHLMSEVEALCNRIHMMHEGELVFEGTIEEFTDVSRPNSILVRFGSAHTKAELEALPMVAGVEAIGPLEARVSLKNRECGLSGFIKACVQAGWDLAEVKEERSSLEDVFSQLSGKVNAAEASCGGKQ